MKKITKIGASILAICSLASCASKCDFAKFQEKAKEALKQDAPFTKATVKGTFKDNGQVTKLDVKAKCETVASLLGAEARTWSCDNAAALIVLNTYTVAHFATIEVKEDVTYYAGSTFKVVDERGDEKTTYTWNKYGMLTSMKSGSDSLRITYSK